MTKKIVALLLIVIGYSISYAQDDDRPQNTGDNFSLEGALSLFKKANSLQEFEKMLNKENNNVNNLDLNNDGDIDYILVDELTKADREKLKNALAPMKELEDLIKDRFRLTQFS